MDLKNSETHAVWLC